MRILDWLIHSKIRRSTNFDRLSLDRFQVRVARTLEEHEAAYRLVHVAYAYQGFENVRSDGLRITPQHMLPEATVLVAYEGKQLVGTMTVTLDSPAGLPLDKEYQSEIASFRERGARLFEIGSLAVVKRCWHQGVTDLLNIAAIALATGPLQATHAVIGINPRAAMFYRAVFAFQNLGRAQNHSELAAPVVGLFVEMKEFRRHLTRHFRKPMASGHLPVEHFFGEPLPCVQLSLPSTLEQAARFKLPRDLFRHLFVEHINRVAKLDKSTAAHLARYRSRQTLDFGRHTINPCRLGPAETTRQS